MNSRRRNIFICASGSSSNRKYFGNAAHMRFPGVAGVGGSLRGGGGEPGLSASAEEP